MPWLIEFNSSSLRVYLGKLNRVYIENGDTAELLQKRVMEQAEWVILPKAIDLIANGVNHVHIYTMNKPDVAGTILKNLSDIYVRE